MKRREKKLARKEALARFHAIQFNRKASPEDKKAALKEYYETRREIDGKPATAPVQRQSRPEPEWVIEGRRPTVTRTATGAILGALPGALVGFAWRKKTRNKMYGGR